MDIRKIKKMIELLENSTLSEMEASDGESTIRLSRISSQQLPPQSTFAAPAQPVHLSATTAHGGAEAPTAQSSASTASEKVVVSPLVGTFYNSSSPEDKPYVALGAKVKAGQTLCLIEAMKTFNQIEAEISGVISTIYKQNGDPVEYGEPLFSLTLSD